MPKHALPSFNMTIDGVEYEVQLARVSNYAFEREEHGIFTDNIVFEGSGWGQGLGGYSLDEYDPISKERIGTAYGMDFIIECYKQLGRIGTIGQQVAVFRSSSGWGGKIDGFVRVSSDGSFDKPFFPAQLANKHYPHPTK